MRMNAWGKSFQVKRPQKMMIVTVQGVSSGKITRQKVPKGVQPSISAASSRSRGMERMKPL